MTQYNWLKPEDLPDDVEIMSVCCSAPIDYDLCGICAYCHDHTGFVAVDADGNELGDIDPSDFC